MAITNKRVLIFDKWAYTPYTEISMEIAERHKERGDDVQIVNVATKLPHWEYIPLLAEKEHYKAVHYRLKKKIQFLRTFAKEKDINYSSELLIDPSKYNFTVPDNISDIHMLKEYQWNDYDMGMGIASLLISRTKDIEPDLQKYRKVINSVFTSSVIILNSFIKWHEKFKPDAIYIYNARTPLNRVILRYCQQMGYNIQVVDRGGAEGKYTITPNYNHDHIMLTNIINDHYKNSPISEPKKREIAEEYFLDRANGKTTKQFVEKQIKESLPATWQEDEKSITFFTSSFTEYAAIDKENNADILFKNQFDAVKEIADFLYDTEYKFYLRIHPNTKNNYPREYAKWVNLNYELKDKFIFIDGDEDVDSYALAKKSDKVVVYMTTLGIESAYWGWPTILIANSPYCHLGSNYTPSNKQELFNLLTTDNLPPKSNLGAVKYGFFYSTYGYDFRHFVYTWKYLGLYRGIDFNTLKSYSLKTRLVAKYLFFMDQVRSKGFTGAIETFFNRKKMTNFKKNPISEM